MGTPLIFFLAYTITFAVMTPVGMAFGLGVSQLAMSDVGYEAAVATLQGELIFDTLIL